MKQTPCYIWDIDGTLADVDHRRKFVDGSLSTKNYDAFHEAMVQDTPLDHNVKLLGIIAFGAPEVEIIFCTGRMEQHRPQTEAWLNTHIPNAPVRRHTLRMRPNDQRYIPDWKVKREMLKQLRAEGYQPIAAFDDRNQVVQMWRNNGVPCYQVANGDF